MASNNVSLHTRLDPRKEEVLKVVKSFGVFRAMEDFQVASYDRFLKWLKEVTGNANFGINPAIALGGSQSLGDQLVAAFLRKLADLEGQRADLQERIRVLEWQLAGPRETEYRQALTVLEACRVEA